MTADRAALVERMCVAVATTWDNEQRMQDCMSAALDLALEEAAKVAEGAAYRTSGTTGEVSIRGTDGGNWSVPMPLSGFKGSDYGTGRYDAAAAIRALKSAS